MLMEKLQKKFQDRAISLKNEIQKINKYMKEKRQYEINSIAKENATLKRKITSAMDDLKTLMSSFTINQSIHFKNLLDSMARMIDLLASQHP